VQVGPVVPEVHLPHQTYNFSPEATSNPPDVISVHEEIDPLAVIEIDPPAIVVAQRITISPETIEAGRAGVTAPVPVALDEADLNAIAIDYLFKILWRRDCYLSLVEVFNNILCFLKHCLTKHFII
jgi:hypothetical protein